MFNQSENLSLRCTKCDKIVTRDNVLPDRPIAKCPDCGFLFEPREMKRGNLEKKSRIQIRRDADSLEIVQKPLRSGLPLWTFLAFFLFDAILVALYFYVLRLFPDENPILMLTEPRNANVQASDGRILFSLLAMHVLLLALPIWSFFDRRTIRIDCEKLTITGRWGLFPWRKSVSRNCVKKATFNGFILDFRNLMLRYGKKFVLIGCTTKSEVEAVCGEINHFLYSVPPKWTDDCSEPTFLGGIKSGDPEIELYCCNCGTLFSGDSLDFQKETVCCAVCDESFPIEEAACVCRVEIFENKQPENITVETDDERLSIRYVPALKKVEKYANIFCLWFCILLLSGQFLFATYLSNCLF